MNKKFLSAILFGALVATTGSFVSCNDDSSDVNGLQEQIDALSAQFNKQIATLQVELNAALDAAKAAQNAADQAVAEAKAQNIQEVMDQLEAYIAEQGFATSEELSKIAAKLEALNLNELEVKISDLEAKLAALDLQNDVLDAYSNLVGQVGENADAIINLQNQVSFLTSLLSSGEATAEIAEKLEALEAAINALNPSLNVLAAGQASSIVFNPDLYMDGIEAQEYIYLVYQPFLPVSKAVGPYSEYDGDDVIMSLSDADSYVQTFENEEVARKFNGHDAKWLWETSNTYVGNFYRNTDVVNQVNYYVNPANAKINLADLALQGKDVMLVTRATPASTVEYNVDYANYLAENGINAENAKGFQAVVEEQAKQKVLKVTVPYTAKNAYEAGLEYARYNGNTYYNYINTLAQSAVSYEVVPVLPTLSNYVATALPGSAKIQGVNRKGSVYCHDLDEYDHEIGNHTNTECDGNDPHDYDHGTESCDEGKSNIFQLQAAVADSAVVSDFAMLYASPITPIAISFTGATVDNHKVLAANKAQDCSKDFHLFRTMQEAIEQPASFNVYYYGDQVDLKDYLEVHVNRYSKIAAHSGFHNKWGYHQIERYGLNWNFELVDWNHGENGVSDTYAHQSQFANPELAKNGIIKPCKIKADGTTDVRETVKTDYDIIGKEPILKVTVTDSNNNDAVVLIGFVKYTIIEKLTPIDMGVIKTFNHTVACDNYVTCPDGFATTWNEYQYNVLDIAASMSYTEFNSLYALDVDADGHAIQYNQTTYAPVGTDCYVDACPRKAGTVGIVQPLDNVAIVGDNDNGLYWEISSCEARKIFWKNADHADSVMVCYRRIDPRHSTKDPIFVKMKVVVDYKFYEPKTISTKIVNYWYDVTKDANGVCISGNAWQAGEEDGVRANVLQPEDYGHTRNFFYDLPSAWYGNVINFEAPAKTPATTAVPYEYFYFHPANNNVKIIGNNGEYYTLKVESTKINTGCSCELTDGHAVHNKLTDGHMGNAECHCDAVVCPVDLNIGTTEQSAIDAVRTAEEQYRHLPTEGTLYQNTKITVTKHAANGTVIRTEDLCTLDKVSGKIQYLWNTPDNTLAKELLNLKRHTEANDHIWVGVYGLNCGKYVYPLKDNVYTVHFIRPIDPTENVEKNLVDATNNIDKFNVFDLFVSNLVDWRDSAFIPNNVWYFAFYNVKSIQVHLDQTTTNLNKSTNYVKLSTVSDYVRFQHLDITWDADGDHVQSYVEKARSFAGPYSTPLNITYNPFFAQATFDKCGRNCEWVPSDVQSDLIAELRNKFGWLTYENNRGNVEDFDIIVPITLTYDWGILPTYNVKVHVDGTINNH